MHRPLAVSIALLLAAASLIAGPATGSVTARRPRVERAAPPPSAKRTSVATSNPTTLRLPAPPIRLEPGFALAADARPALDVPTAGLPPGVRADRVPDSLRVFVQLDRFGMVRRVGLREGSGSAALDSSAAAAARWAVFPGRAEVAGEAAWWPLTVRFDRTPAEPLEGENDAITSARAAERAGDRLNALYLWMGALGRVGVHPEFANVWSLRERAILAALMLSPTPVVPLKYLQEFGRLEGLSERAISTEANTQVLERITPVLTAAPWHGPAWRIRAAAEAALGQPVAAMRSLSCWQLASPDSSTAARVEAARALIASGDLLMASRALQQP